MIIEHKTKFFIQKGYYTNEINSFMLRTRQKLSRVFRIKFIFLSQIYSYRIMKYNKLLSSVLTVVCFFVFLTSQTPLIAQEHLKSSQIDNAIELYKTSNYIAAGKIFNDLLLSTPDNDPIQYDLDYYRLMCKIKQNDRFAEGEITNYLSNKGESPWENQLWYELAKLQFENRKYKAATKNFENVDPFILSNTDLNDFRFFCGYSNFEAGDLKKASQYFFEIKKGNSQYASSASYYWGYINYLDGKYETALQEFKKLENNPQFSGFIPYYTIQIYYIQEKYDLVIEIGEKIANSAPEEQKNELLKIVGDAYFETGKYINAIKFLDEYKGVGGKKTREDFYKLGYCYYQIGNFKKAIDAFENVTTEDDTMAQNAFYHLADCNLKLNNKKDARAAFEQASKLSFNPKIEEDALFNYAKLSYELSYSPFNETIKAFDQYISKYPDSERNDAAFDYLVKVYMTTRNYRDAISSIEKIKVKSPSVKEAYQRVTYYRGIELFNDGNYKGAMGYFSKSLENSSYNASYKAQAIYWNAESNYRTGQYQKAIDGFVSFQATPGSFSLPEFGTAYYNIGYCYFNLKKYDESSVWFRKYLNQSKTTNQLKADANNRTGDCYYQNREYLEAIKNYSSSITLNSFDPDYALYQRAICQGLEKNYAGKNSDLLALLGQFPNSSYIDDAMFELARNNEKMNEVEPAIENYNKIISQMPQSVFARKALLQLGLIYYNKNDFKNSLIYYKKVVENYPNTDESNAALVGIKNNYIDMNKVDDYFDYSSSIGNKVQVASSAQDSIYYMAVEKRYMSGDSTAVSQFEDYLTRFPNGSFRLNASYYLAESYYNKAEFSKSLDLYREVVSRPDNIFSESSLLKAGELTFNAKNYNEALGYFLRLEKMAGTKWNILKSKAGIMRSYFKLEDPSNSILAANRLLSTENITETMIREANFILASSYYKLSQPDDALKYYSILAVDTKTAEGAESKYYKAQILFDRKMLTESESEIMDFINKNSPHQYWLAKSFILLSDIYLVRNDLFQARHTLSSLIDNYVTQTDGIIDIAKEKMDVIESIENQNLLQNKVDTIK
jgi:tetratricopeptide (TPR) repeat protein